MDKRKIVFIMLVALATVFGSRLRIFEDTSRAEAMLLTDVSQIDPTDLGDFPSAAEGIEVFQERVKRNANDVVSLTILGQLYLRQARETGDVSRYQQAEAALHRALELLPNYPPANIALATTLYSQHNFVEAVDLAERLFRDDPRRSEALATMGDAYMALGRYQSAEEAYQELIRRGSTPPVLARLAHVAQVQGRPHEALRLLQQAAGETLAAGQSKQEMAWYLVRLAEHHFNAGHLDEARDYYEAALGLDDNYYIALAGLGKVSAGQGAYAEAIDYYQQALAIVPYPETHAALGDLYTLVGQMEQARQQYDTVEFLGQLAEINQQLYNRQLATFFADHDWQLDQALELAVAELEWRQDIPGFDTAAWAYYKNGRFDQAQEMIEQAMQYGTRDAKLYFHAGMIAEARGQQAEARRLLTEALTINPYFDLLQARLAQQTLERLQSQS